MSTYLAEYRRGDRGIASRNDWAREVEAESPEAALQAVRDPGHEADVFRDGEGGVFGIVADDTTRDGGRYEHAYYVSPAHRGDPPESPEIGARG